MNKMRQKTVPISRMVDLCESYSPFHVCLTICPFAHLVYATSHLSFVVRTQDVRTDVWSNKHEKGYNSRENQPSVKSVKYVHSQIMANQDTKYE
jgi:hypothetical protein